MHHCYFTLVREYGTAEYCWFRGDYCNIVSFNKKLQRSFVLLSIFSGRYGNAYIIMYAHVYIPNFHVLISTTSSKRSNLCRLIIYCIFVHYRLCLYSGTPLIRPPFGQNILVVLRGGRINGSRD